MRYPDKNLLALAAACYPSSHHGGPFSTDLAWYEAEMGYLASLKSRVTGAPTHNRLIDHIECQLEAFGLPIYSDHYQFSYMNQSMDSFNLIAGDSEVDVSSYYPYSGITGD